MEHVPILLPPMKHTSIHCIKQQNHFGDAEAVIHILVNWGGGLNYKIVRYLYKLCLSERFPPVGGER